MENRIKTFEEACATQGLDPVKVLPDLTNMPEQDRAAVIALAKMCIIQRSLNGNWKPDWGNSSQYKYYPWFDVEEKEDSSSGFALSFIGYVYVYVLTCTGLGARLFYRDIETAKYAGTTFIDLYEDMILQPK